MLCSTAVKAQESKKKICFIVNPISGTGKHKNIETLIQHVLDQKQFDYKILYTEKPKHAIELSRSAALEGTHIIVAVGGDGSVNEVTQGIIGSHATLAIIPTGSGNGCARCLGIPQNLTKAIKIINHMYSQWVDTVQINQYFYLGVAGIGFDADMSLAFSHLKKRGVFSYLLLILHKFFYYKPQDYRLIIDGKQYNEKAFLICFANTRQYGNNAFIAPHAKVDDGYLDVIVWKEFPPYAAFKLVHDLFTQHLYDSQYTKTFLCKEVILKKSPHILHIDGESITFDTDIHIRILPSSLKILIPQTD